MSAINLTPGTPAGIVTPTTGTKTLFLDSTNSNIPSVMDETRTLSGFATKASIGLGNVDNTSDISKPVSTAMQTALDLKESTTRPNNWFNKAIYNVLDNGISTANTGAQNVTAWNALMTLIPDSGTVYFPPAAIPYDFASVCNIPSGKHIKVVGGGPNTRTSDAFGTIIRTTSATANIFSCSDWYQDFQQLQFRSSVTRTAGAAILSGDNVGICVYDCHFHQMFNAIEYSGGAQSGNLAVVRNCGFTNTVNFSIKIDGTNANTIITECVGDGTAGVQIAHIELNACGSLLMSSCDWIHAINNLRLNPDSGTKGVFSVYCTNIFFDTASGSSVKFLGGAAGTNVQRVKFANCWFSGSVTGCEFAAVTSTNKPAGIDFINCDIFSNSAFGVLATEVQDFALNNCRIAGNSTAGVRTNAAAGSVTKFNIQNSNIGPCSGIGANGIGIDIVAGTYNGYFIGGNNVAGNTGNNNIADAGSVTSPVQKQIANNLGHLLLGAVTSQGGTQLSVPITTETLVLSTRVLANSVKVGQVFRLRAIGVMSAANSTTWRVKVGTNGSVADTACFTATGAAGVANGRHGMEAYLTVRSVGAGSVNAEGLVHSGTAAGTITFAQPALGAATTTIVTTTADWFIDITLSQTIGTSLIQQAVIEAL